MKNRRSFIKKTGLFLGGLSVLPKYTFASKFQKKKLGVCLVGLGNYSENLLAPALQLTQHCELKGVVTGSPNKIPVWQRRYGILDRNIYNYDTMDDIANNPDIDVIYIVLPTGLHSQYAIKAAETGKHVWCEKPMAKTVEECEAIIKACNKNKVKLSIGYRMQHEPNTQTLIKWSHTRPYGKIETVKAEIGFNIQNPGNTWRMDKGLGGGLIYDVGVYSINGIRYTTGSEPISVTALHKNTRPEIFKEVEETTIFTLNFNDGLTASGKTTAAESVNILKADCENGWYQLQPFQSYTGVKGKTSDGQLLDTYIENQQAKQMDDDALSILQNKPIMVPGEEGLKDIAIVEAINESARLGSSVIL
ncbi:Gfo/Idh/MocA family protein [Euzebyella saccharophila]|uniref:Gfo/Idh/MocA family protein n=1 Tax=Euzebyella saccharophila TaxID=679664 RepID=A0ABV8JR49_9FLAO|nr:Gfo/Idh/MocA family oxidoreductase [Euzebyella saccharophila]